MLAIHLCVCLVVLVIAAHLLVCRVPDWLFIFSPIVFFVPDLFCMNNIWGTIPDWFTAVAAAITAYFAGIGVSAWRQKLIGENEYQLSVRLQELLFEIQKSVKSTRRDYSTPNRAASFNTAMSVPGTEFDNLCLKGRAHWGDDFHNLFLPILNLINELRHTLNLLNTAPQDYQNEHFEDLHQISHGNDDESDAFSIKWNRAVKDLEKYLKQYIKR